MSKFIASDKHVSEYPSDHADSSTSLMAVDEGIPFDADSRGQFKGSRHSARRCFTQWQNWPLIITLLFLIAGLSVWANVIIFLGGFRCYTTPGTDHFVPDLLYSNRVTFQPHKFYGGPPSNATDEMWERISPPGKGIIEVPTEYTGSLPASLPAPNNPDTAKVYGVSMFHQLHCLNFLRLAYYPGAITTMTPDELVLHRDHCLDYIRQAIMCAGDVTLEPLTKVGINGMGAVHQCRDFDHIFSWAYERRLYKVRGSGYTGGVVTHVLAHGSDIGDEGIGGEPGH